MPSHGGRILGGILVSTLLFFAQARAENSNISQLNEITIDEVDDEIVIGVKGTKLPDFTSFTMHKPYRIVIDWAGSQLNEVPRSQKFERNLIRIIRTEQFSSESEQISRVVIELAAQTRYRLETIGREVFVRFTKVELPINHDSSDKKNKKKLESIDPNEAAIASLGDEPIPEGPLTEPAEVPAPPAPSLIAPLPAELLADIKDPKPKLDKPPVPARKKEAPVLAKGKDSVPEKNVSVNKTPTAPTPKISLARLAPKVKPTIASNIAAPKAVSIKTAATPKAQEKPLLKEAASAKPQAESPAAPPVRLASSADLSRRAPEKEIATAKPSVQTQDTVDEITVEDLEIEEEKPKVVQAPVPKLPAAAPQGAKTPPAKLSLGKLAAKPAPKQPAPAPKPVQRLAQLKPKLAKAPPAKVAVKPWIQAAKPARVQAPPPEPIKPPTIAKVKSEKRRSQGKISFDGTHEFKPGKRVMKYIGFRQKAQVSEVFIRCDGKTKFRVVEDSNTKVVIELFDTTIRLKNNQRALDTSFFPTAVKRVHARADAAGTRVEIALRHKVPYEVKRVGSTIKLLFNNAAR